MFAMRGCWGGRVCLERDGVRLPICPRGAPRHWLAGDEGIHRMTARGSLLPKDAIPVH